MSAIDKNSLNDREMEGQRDRQTDSKTERGAIKMLFVEHRINNIS